MIDINTIKEGDVVKWLGNPTYWPYGVIVVFSVNRIGRKLSGKGMDYTGRVHTGLFFPEELTLVCSSQPQSLQYADGVGASTRFQQTTLPSEAADRKKIPITSGVLDYFSAAIAEVSKVSYAGNEQHNPGEPLHWSRGKSADHADCIARHLLERGTVDTDGQRHSAKLAWRALALLQLELEAEGAPVARGAKE